MESLNHQHMKKQHLNIIVSIVVILFLGYLFLAPKNEEITTSEKTISQTASYTCSMHPQIRQTEQGDCPICGMQLISLQDTQEGLAPYEFKMTPNAVALANIETVRVGTLLAEDHQLKLAGKIVANEEAYVLQAAYYNGRIEQLFVNYEGQQLQKGQPIATLYSPQLIAAQQELITAARIKETQPELYKAVRNKLKLWKLSEGQINQIEASGEVKNKITLYASASGIASELKVASGDYVSQGAPLLKITSLKSVWAVFDAYEYQLASLKKDQKIDITVNALPGEVFKANISFIDPVMNENTRVVHVRAVLPNTKGNLKPGMFLEGYPEIATTKLNKRLLIPASAVLWTGKRSVVYVKTSRARPVFEMKEVLLANKINDSYEVLKGLSPEDEIVINGTFTVDAAAQLSGKKSMMNREASEAIEIDVSASFEQQFNEVIKIYLQLKDALVSSNAGKASEKATILKNLLKKLAKENKEALNESWTLFYNNSDQIARTGSLEIQRSAFQLISENMIAVLANFKETHTPLYVQKCPMAANNQGALWISAEREIKNPYFGDVMLRCGNVEKVLFE
jgi:Cu(I)/Ag(I) efflux system membrane fusion protein